MHRRQRVVPIRHLLDLPELVSEMRECTLHCRQCIHNSIRLRSAMLCGFGLLLECLRRGHGREVVTPVCFQDTQKWPRNSLTQENSPMPTIRLRPIVAIIAVVFMLAGCSSVSTELSVGKDLRVTGGVRIDIPMRVASERFGPSDPDQAIAGQVNNFNSQAPDGVSARLERRPKNFSIYIRFDEVRPQPLAAQGGGSFLIYLLPRVDMLRDKYLFQTYHPARAVFRTENIDVALAELKRSGMSMTMSVTFPGKVIEAPNGASIDGRTVSMDLTEINDDLIRIRADPPGFPWWTLGLLPFAVGLVIWMSVVVINRFSRGPSGHRNLRTSG